MGAAIKAAVSLLQEEDQEDNSSSHPRGRILVFSS